MMERMVQEEEILQVLRSADDPIQDFEFRGYLSDYKVLLKHPSIHFVGGLYTRHLKEDNDNTPKQFLCKNVFKIQLSSESSQG